jgi:hypothetical protein
MTEYCDEGSCGYLLEHTGGHSWETDLHLIKKLDDAEDRFKKNIRDGNYDIIMGHKMYTSGYNAGLVRGYAYARKLLNLERKDDVREEG